jgi:hypothetical protein
MLLGAGSVTPPGQPNPGGALVFELAPSPVPVLGASAAAALAATLGIAGLWNARRPRMIRGPAEP